MARQVHTPVVAQGGFGAYGVGTVTGAWLPADVANKEQVTLTGNELIIAYNSDAGGAHTVTVTSVVNDRQRVKDITAYSIALSSTAIFGPFPVRGWRSAGGLLLFESDSATVKFIVVKLPG